MTDNSTEATGNADALPTEAPAIDAPSTDAPAIDAPSTDAPGIDVPTTEFAGARLAARHRGLSLPERYQDLGFLGRGGMGEVRRVRDRQLKRIVAMKIIRLELMEQAGSSARFLEEAQATAQLQHPGIVPVHDQGALPDGRLYFTMKEVQGRTFRQVIRALHALPRFDAEQDSELPGAPPWTFRRLIDAYHKVCEAVAYAHERGVVHRDLKPSNLMLGPFGEVLVMDWGLARIRGQLEAAAAGDADPIETERSRDPQLLTRAGQVAGTPAYMAPEQARADVAKLGPASDVYSLGAVLYEILSGRPPYVGSSATEVLEQVLQGSPVGVAERGPDPGLDETLPPASSLEHRYGRGEGLMPATPHPFIPDDLRHICERAMARDPADRYPDARMLAEAVGQWLEGVQRRERAQRVAEEAAALPGRIRILRNRAAAQREQARSLLSSIRGYEPIERRQAGWVLEDEAAALERDADQLELHYLQALRGALMLDPELEDAHEQLAAYYRERHQEAEVNGDQRAAAQYEVLLQSADRTGRYATWLTGDGALTLWTDPDGVEVELYRYEAQGRRLVERFERSLGRTPITRLNLPRGSYLLMLRAPGRAVVRYPVHIARGEHWDGVRPGSSDPYPILLPLPEALGAEDCYIPAGWYWSGGDSEAYNHLPRKRLWVDGLVMRRFPVTNREYLEYLNALVAAGREAEALEQAPRERGALADAGPVIYGRDARGRFVLRADADGDMWEPGWPVIMIDLAGAIGYAAWAARSGVPWRLPGELEWEKAARGVDGRLFPWGAHWDPAWARMSESAERPTPVVVDSYPDDVSVYGVRGPAGNVRDWCADLYAKDGPPTPGGRVLPPPELPPEPGLNRVNRGGDWYGAAAGLRCSSRFRMGSSSRYGHIGMRLVRSM